MSGWGVGGCRAQRYEALHEGGRGVSGRSLRNANFEFYLPCFQPFDCTPCAVAIVMRMRTLSDILYA